MEPHHGNCRSLKPKQKKAKWGGMRWTLVVLAKVDALPLMLSAFRRPIIVETATIQMERVCARLQMGAERREFVGGI